jgi:hypothetical protein
MRGAGRHTAAPLGGAIVLRDKLEWMGCIAVPNVNSHQQLPCTLCLILPLKVGTLIELVPSAISKLNHQNELH